MFKVGVDVGGTFTDTYGRDDSKVYTGKSLTTPDDLSEGIVKSIRSAGIDLKKVDLLIHGSTIATNSLLQRNYYGWWPKVAYITTEGFRDTLEIRRGRNQLYGQINMYGTAPKPLIERQYRFTLGEKIDVDGNVIKEVDEGEVKDLVVRVKKIQPDSIAIVFVNSYVNPENEMKAKELIQKEFPTIPVYTSAEVSPKFRELGRMITVTVRALLAPIIVDYMDKIEKTLKEYQFSGELLIVKGDGGTCTVNFIKEHPEMLLESGPAAGVYAGEVIGRMIREENAITQDTGGTSYDVCVIEKNKHLQTTEYEIELDMPMVISMTDVRSIGTGGGSIIWIDEGGSLRVGPQSAGAKPGPVCYGLGGKEPTITDANLLLGRIDRTLGGKIELDTNLTKEVFKEKLANPLGQDIYKVAEGAIKIACVNMARANMLVTTSRGRDPRKLLPILFGGAGGMHACFVAEELGVNKAFIPCAAGVASAMGMTMMPLSVYAEKTFYMELANPKIKELNAHFNKLKEEVISELVRQGAKEEEIVMHRELEMRYIGQNYEVTVEEPIDFEFEEKLEKLKEDFNNVHLKEHGINNPTFPVAIVNIRVRGTEKIGIENLPIIPKATYGIEEALRDKRQVYFEGKFIETPIYDFDKLTYGHMVDGPGVIEMLNSCVVITPGWKALIDKYGDTILEKK